MNYALLVDLDVLKQLLENILGKRKNIDLDIHLIEFIVDRWIKDNHKPSLKYLADKLIDLGNTINTEDKP